MAPGANWKGFGLMGTLLRYPYEVRDEKEHFGDIQDVKVTKDMLDLAKHIHRIHTSRLFAWHHKACIDRLGVAGKRHVGLEGRS